MTKMEWADNGNQIIDGVEYAGRKITSLESSPFGRDPIIVFEGHEVFNECDKCGRFSTRRATASSIPDAVARGYIRQVGGASR